MNTNVESISKAPIFIVGTGRSGTTLLRLMLNAHPNIYLTHEAGFFHFIKKAGKSISPRNWLEYYSASMPYKWQRLDTARLLRSISGQESDEAISSLITEIMRTKAKEQGKARIGDKSPYHALCLEEIYATYPHAKVIYVIRDPRETVASLIRMPWATGSTVMAAIYCNIIDREVQKYSSRIHTVRLEDLLKNKVPSLREILDFIQEPWNESVLHHEKFLIKQDVPSAPWLQSSKQKTSTSVGKGHNISDSTKQNIAWICKRLMQRHGYTAEQAVAANRWNRLCDLIKDIPNAIACTTRLAWVSLLTKNCYQISGERAMELYLKLNPKAWRHYPETSCEVLVRETFSKEGDLR